MEQERWRRVEALYHSALERPPEYRAAFLTEACADQELRREVETLLAQPGDGILDHPVTQAVAGGRLGPYEIRRLIGAGGMGQVFEARDSRLGRSVAIKICSAEFASRFAREAQAISALNHANICTLYDVGPNYLVMELVEGPTLAERLKQGPVPLEEALATAKQIAEAVEAAHEKGIIHRDLKPGNIKLRPDGTVKVLDFGLAKVTESNDAGPLPEDSPTVTLEAATRVGTILGTAAYMSPEQALGKAADKRADIWSFGAVLYELLSGRRAFGGESASDILAAVLKVEPDWSALPQETPAAIRTLIRRCLMKDRRQRLQAIGDARIVIEERLSGAPPEMVEPAPVRRSIVPWAVAGVLAIVAIASIAVAWRATRPVDRPLVRLDVDLGPEVTLPNLARGAHNVILSPDGTRLVYVSGNPSRLYTRRLDQSKATELPGTDDAVRPFFSPDGQWVGFSKWLGTKLSKISVEGGAVVPLADVGGRIVGGSWGSDGNIIVGGLARGLIEVPTSGGSPTTVLETAPGDSSYIFPQILPGGKAVLFDNRRRDPSNNDSIEVFSFTGRQRKTVVRGGANPYYLPSGHLIYTSKGTLFAIAFDLNRLETRGMAVPILDDAAYFPSTDGVDLHFAQNGALVYRHGPGMPLQFTVQWLDVTGKKEPLLEPGAYSLIRISPDGKRLAVTVAGDAWVNDLKRDVMTRLTSGGDYPGLVWSPDGRYVILSSRSKGIYWTRADGAGQPQPLTQSEKSQTPWSFTPDGKWLAYYESAGSGGRSQIWMLPLEAQDGQLKAGKPEQFLRSQFNDFYPVFSPDGHWIAYDSDASGKLEVYVRAFPPPASGQPGQWQISNGIVGRYTRSVWSQSSRDLIYLSGDQLMAVSYSVNGDSFVAEKPRVWMDKLGGIYWDLAPDGKRVAVVTPVVAPEVPKPDHEVTILFNFFDELRRRVPPK